MSRVVVILLAVALDLSFGDPPNRFHPVVLMGRWLTWGRTLAPKQRRFWFGAGWTAAGLALFGGVWIFPSIFKARRETGSAAILPPRNLPLLGGGAKRTSPPAATAGRIEGGRVTRQPVYPLLRGVLPLLTTALLLKLVTTYRSLRRAVLEVAAALNDNDLAEARRLLSWHLVSRDTSSLTAEEVAGAAIESLTENVTDGLTAPLLTYAVGGLPMAWAYRLVNTADAMWGYRNEEFEQLGKFPARLDDALNWLPARLTGWLFVAAAWLVGADARQAARVMLAHHGRTPSPNAGWTMSAAAGALGVTLTKREVYALGEAQGPLDVTTIQRAVRLADVCVGLVVAGAVGLAWRRGKE